VDEGRQVNLSGEKESLLKKRSVERLISFLGAFRKE